MKEIYCLMYTGMALNDEIRTLLLEKAIKMALDGEKKLKVKSYYCEGIISTQWARKCIGSASGVEFYAEIETDRGSTKVSYIVQTKNFNTDDGEWVRMKYDSPAFDNPISAN